jgi:hypothetical protein
MLDITRIALPKEHLQKLTAGERSLFLLLGFASNQINTLWKLVIVATNEGTKDPSRTRQVVSAAQEDQGRPGNAGRGAGIHHPAKA